MVKAVGQLLVKMHREGTRDTLCNDYGHCECFVIIYLSDMCIHAWTCIFYASKEEVAYKQKTKEMLQETNRIYQT